MTGKELQTTTVPVAPNNFDRFIDLAISNKVGVETLERLLAMQKDIMMTNAKAAYDESLAQFQSECPIIHKDKKVDFTSKRTGNKTSYSYAPLDSIVGQVKDALKKNGFSYSMTAEITVDSWVLTTCKLTHIQGHAETSSFKVPIDKEAFMNAQQQVAAALTYAKRYAFCNVTGILTGDQDDDAHGADSPQNTPPTGEQKNAPQPQPAPQKKEPAKDAPALDCFALPKGWPADAIKGYVSNVVDKASSKPGGKIKYYVTISEQAYSTFSKTIRDDAEKSFDENLPVAITIKATQYGTDIIALVALKGGE